MKKTFIFTIALVCELLSFAQIPENVQQITNQQPIDEISKFERNIFVGLNGTLGTCIFIEQHNYYSYNIMGVLNYSNTFYKYSFNLSQKIGVDFAYPVAEKFAIGFYLNSGRSFTLSDVKRNSYEFKVGMFMLAGDVNNSPFIVGIAPCTGLSNTDDGDYLPFELRFGRVINKYLYITGNFNIGFSREKTPNVTTNVIATWNKILFLEPSISVGYHFGDKLKRRK